MTHLLQPEPWMVDALCAVVDPELFYPEKGESAAAAKMLCRRCPVRAECLAYALASHEKFGVWGGLSERERRKLLAARGQDSASRDGLGAAA